MMDALNVARIVLCVYVLFVALSVLTGIAPYYAVDTRRRVHAGRFTRWGAARVARRERGVVQTFGDVMKNGWASDESERLS